MELLDVCHRVYFICEVFFDLLKADVITNHWGSSSVQCVWLDSVYFPLRRKVDGIFVDDGDFEKVLNVY